MLTVEKSNVDSPDEKREISIYRFIEEEMMV